MAEGAVLQAFIQVVFEKLSTAALHELGFLRTAEDYKELSSLVSTLSSIRALIEDAEEKQLKDKAVRLWLLRLKDVAYEIDDLLDDYAAQDTKSKLQQPNLGQWIKVWNHLRYYICLSSELFKHELAVQIREINLNLDKLAKERDYLGLQMFGGTSQLEFTERPTTGSLVDNSSIFGREDDKENIIKMVLARSGLITVLAIVGMGGLGKTTLAQLVYNDARIKEHFQIRIWVCVSENFDVIKLTKEAIESVFVANLSTNINVNNFSTGHSFTTTNISLLQEDLCNKLKGKRFLLVLDDVWNEDSNKWESYYRALAVGERGSTIIVTTRNESVGQMMRAAHSYKLKQLSDEDCWKLFKNYAFVNSDSSSYPNLEKIGKEIVRKLKGLPLAAKALGSLLYSKAEERDWRSIAKSEIWELPSDKNNILPALRLSYKHLPPHLKQCFAFCSIFHKDYVFEKDRLVYIWIALGFIEPQSGRKLEDVGNSYFDDLLGRSFFQIHKGRYVMHDAIHDLAQSISADECHRLAENARGLVPERIRHVSFSCDNSKPTSFQAFFCFEKMRTLLLLRGHKSSTEPIPTELFVKLKYIRVLDLNRQDISVLPDSIGNLKQLRYLNISGTRISSLPPTIAKLRNLQTLRLNNCDALDDLPKGITRLVNLRHLEASTRLVRKISGIGSLTSLQELEEFVVHKEKGYHIQELGAMAELTGSLSIKDLENVSTMVEASAARLNGKEYLTAIHLIWSQERRVVFNEECLENQVLEFLQPNDHLKEITIKGFMGSKFPSWLHNLSFIQTVHLFDCKYSKSFPPLGKLRMLKYLDIGGFDSVAHISEEFLASGDGGFPSLTELVLQDMLTLEDWVGDGNVEDLPCLNELQLLQCPKLQHLPLLPPNLTRIRISESGFTILPRLYSSSPMPKPSLVSLQIHDCPNLTSLQGGLLDQKLEFLKELIITDCEELVYVPVNGFLNFASLKILHIYNCPKLMLPIRGTLLLPPLLEDLRITECNKIINPIIRKIEHVSSLMHLSIKECKDLILFSEEGLPLGLRILEVFSCENLISLPAYLRELQALTTLTIVNCPLIPCLPPNGLPETLQELYIKDCPLLMESCQESGIDQPKIAHVPNVQIEDTLSGQRIMERSFFNDHHTITIKQKV